MDKGRLGPHKDLTDSPYSCPVFLLEKTKRTKTQQFRHNGLTSLLKSTGKSKTVRSNVLLKVFYVPLYYPTHTLLLCSVCPIRFWHKRRRRCRAVAVSRITTCTSRFSELAPSLRLIVFFFESQCQN